MANADIRQLEMDGKVFYPQTDIHGLVNNGAYAIDDEPTEHSTNLVTSDSVYRIKSETLLENREMVDSVIQDYAPVEIHGDVTNAADEEDLTSTNVSGTDVLKFKDKVYNQLVYSGLGRKILRKNMVNGVNTLTQSMINDENTIYIIQYDFVLGEDIRIPNDCVLEFDGGSISGTYTLTGTNTGISAGLVKIFNTDVTLDGTWNITEAYPELFGAKRDGVTDDITAINKTISSFPTIPIKFSTGTYLISNSIDFYRYTMICGNGAYLTSIKYTGTEYAIKIFGTYTNFKYPQLRQIGITTTNIGQGIGIGMDICQNNNLIEDCIISDFNIGINVAKNQTTESDTRTYNCYLLVFNRIRFTNLNTGISFNNEGNRVSITDCSFMRISDVAVNIVRGYDVTISRTHFESMIGNAVRSTKGSMSVKLVNSYFEDCGSSEKPTIDISADDLYNPTDGTAIYGCYFSMVSANTIIKLVNTRYTTIFGNTFAAYGSGSQTETIIDLSNNCTFKYVFSNSYYYSSSLSITKCLPGEIDEKSFMDIDGTIYRGGLTISSYITDLKLISTGTNSTIKLRSFSNRLYVNDRDGDELLVCDGGYNTTQGKFINETRTIGDTPSLPANQKGRCIVFDGTPAWWDGNLWRTADGAKCGISKSGTFANKPTSDKIYVGFKYFCTDKQTAEGATDGIEIIHKGNDVWVDALGRVVS